MSINQTAIKQRVSASMLRASQQRLLCSLIDLARQDWVVPYWVCDIAPRLGIHATTLTRRLKILEQLGLISRTRTPHSRAAVQLNMDALEHLPLRLDTKEAEHG